MMKENIGSEEEGETDADVEEGVLDESEDESDAPEKVTALGNIEAVEPDRVLCGVGPLDDLLGDGAVLGSSILLGGPPGAGKSTLMTQVLSGLTTRHTRVMYGSGEEANERLATRVQRLELKEKNKHLDKNVLVLHTDDFEQFEEALTKHMPDIIVLDSIQIFESSEIDTKAGSVKQLKFICVRMTKWARKLRKAGKLGIVFLICHFTKDNDFNGPRGIEHWVDVTLKMNTMNDDSGTKTDRVIVSSPKNRFSTGIDTAHLRMTSHGLLPYDGSPTPKPQRVVRRFKK